MAHGLARQPIDTHAHLWDLAVSPQPWIDESMSALNRNFLAGDLVDCLRAVGVPSAVLVQATSSLDETTFLLDQAAAPEIAGVVGWVDVAGDVPAQRAAFAEHPRFDKLVGIRHPVHIEEDPDWLLRAEVERGIRHLAKAGLAFDLVVRPWQLRKAAELAARVPEAAFVLNHLGKPPIAGGDLGDWRADLALLAERENVVAKVSGITIEADWQAWSTASLRPVIDQALALFGPQRLMFGSDWPLVRLTRGGYAGWLDAYTEGTAELSASEIAAIDAGNARRTYRIGA